MKKVTTMWIKMKILKEGPNKQFSSNAEGRGPDGLQIPDRFYTY